MAGACSGCRAFAAIVRSLHLFGRQESDELQPVAVNQLVASILALHRSRFNRDGITLECTYGDALPEIMCRSNQIVMALMHLMQNARLALNARFTDYDENKLLRDKRLSENPMCHSECSPDLPF